MNFKLIEDQLKNIKADCEIILVLNQDMTHKWVQDSVLLEQTDFHAKSDEVVYLASLQRVYATLESLDHDAIRLAVANAYKCIKNNKFETLKLGIYGDTQSVSALVEGFVLGDYAFDKYKTQKATHNIHTVLIASETYDNQKIDIQEANTAIARAQIIANATNEAKEIVNTAPYEMTPVKLAEYAKNLADSTEGIECFIGDETFLEKEQMGAFLAVARASSEKPRLIHLSYKPANAKKRFVFIGKGLTYDSGGLSLKPSEHMVSMKSDKSGASAALHIIKAAALLKLPFEVHAVIGAAENMIGGNAYKPDDVLIARNGKSIEVRNTDAEGRLVLADCLDYAQDLNPDAMFDLATLTGACVVALGEYTSVVMGHSKDLKESFLCAAEQSGELAATLPFNNYLKKLLKSNVADLSNISSSRYGGAITAGLFLDHFIKDEFKDKWLHLDIAGPAYIEKDWGYNQCGASGAGVRMCTYWMIKAAKEDA
ncbi:leucyl aminopeptidase [Sulfurospirillum sp. 1612]|uniref:leucyl aminopeptidase n=1 Tax=Sulfurospirillum sp. 1612 TaxID=3094835 RepID=UPI002F950993